MANTKISGMGAPGALADANIVPVVQTAGVSNVKVALSAIRAFFMGAPGAIGGTTPAAAKFTTVDGILGSVTPAAATVTTLSTNGGANLVTTTGALTDGAAASAGTLTNAPAAGNPTKWIAINDNGTARHIPAW